MIRERKDYTSDSRGGHLAGGCLRGSAIDFELQRHLDGWNGADLFAGLWCGNLHDLDFALAVLTDDRGDADGDLGKAKGEDTVVTGATGSG